FISGSSCLPTADVVAALSSVAVGVVAAACCRVSAWGVLSFQVQVKGAMAEELLHKLHLR
ncbi:hypothetical protein Tco_1300224, partial [Tanacetum coccineum]